MTPKQALKDLEEEVIDCILPNCQGTIVYVDGLLKTIKQALTELEKQTQILEVLKNKEVDIFLVSITDCVEEYNELLGGNRKKYPLTEEEYNLLKEWLK